MGKLSKLLSNFSNKKEGIFVFLRAQLSSQIATLVDNGLAFLIKKILDILRIKVIYFFSHGIKSYVFATVIGQIFGGLFSCFINYKWTFKDLNIKFKYVLMKFLIVWIFSLLLNTYFTFIMTEWLKNTTFIEGILGDYNSDDIFIFVKLFVAFIVGILWNYMMYKHFVFKDISYKRFMSKISKNN